MHACSLLVSHARVPLNSFALAPPYAERSAYDYAADSLHCKLSPQPPAVLQPRRHLQLGEGYVVQNDVSAPLPVPACLA